MKKYNSNTSQRDWGRNPLLKISTQVLFTLLLIVIGACYAAAQTKVTVTGKVLASGNNEPIAGASINEEELRQ